MAAATDTEETFVDGGLDDDLDTAALVMAPTRRRLTPLTAVLVLALLATASFAAGVRIEKGQLNPAQAVSVQGAGQAGAGTSGRTGGRTGVAPGAGNAGAGNAGAGTGAGAGPSGGSGFGGRGGAVAGQIVTIDGQNLYVSDSSGDITKVVAGDGSVFTKTVPGTIGDVKPGATVVVRGTKAPDGTYNAASVSLSSG